MRTEGAHVPWWLRCCVIPVVGRCLGVKERAHRTALPACPSRAPCVAPDSRPSVCSGHDHPETRFMALARCPVRAGLLPVCHSRTIVTAVVLSSSACASLLGLTLPCFPASCQSPALSAGSASHRSDWHRNVCVMRMWNACEASSAHSLRPLCCRVERALLNTLGASVSIPDVRPPLRRAFVQFRWTASAFLLAR